MHKIAIQPPPPSLDLEIIAEAKEILGVRFADLLKRFIADTNGLLSTIEFSRASNNYTIVRDCAHSLKSASYQMGAAHVHTIAAQIENFLYHNHSLKTIDSETTLDGMIDALQNAFATYQTDISRLL